MSRTASLLVAASLLIAACGSDGDGSSGAGIPGVDAPGATDGAPPDTTVDSITDPDTTLDSIAGPATTSIPEPTTAPASTAAPDSTTIPTTDAGPASTPAPTTSTVPPSVFITDPGQTSWIAGTEEGDPEVVGDGVNCLPFYEATGAGALTYSACGQWSSVDGVYVWTVVKGATDRFFAIVWQPTGPFNWVPKLRLLEPAAGTWDSVTIKAADIDSGPNQELVSGIRYAGTGAIRDLDVIDIRSGNPAVVAALPGLDSPIAFTDDSVGVWIWLPDRKPEEPLCCPSTWSQFLLSSVPGSWIVSEGIAGVPLATIPGVPEF